MNKFHLIINHQRITFSMKNSLLLVSATLILLLSFSSCFKKRLCKNVDCEHGICEYGICQCADGWLADGEGKCTIKEPCFGIDCGHGTCNLADESCTCDPNYELDSLGKCNQALREKFLGTWTGSHITSLQDTVGPYSMTFTEVSSDIRKVQISNFGNYYCGFTGAGLVVTGQVPISQTVGYFESFCTGIETSGTIAFLDETHISISLMVTQNSQLVQCLGVFTRQ
jgi:hypothetical protein